MGRPSSFTPELLEEISDRLAKGEPLAVICRDDHMPSDRTVRNWMADADIASVIARAREVGFDVIASDCLNIADDKGGEPQRDRLRVDTRLKLLAKWDPKRYGDKLAVGGDPDAPPIKSELKVSFV